MKRMEKSNETYLRIVEQPARSAVRFRYECEGRSAGPIPGINSSPSCATYPTVQIMNYTGSRAMIVVSCVTVTPPFKQHPHHLVGRVGCHNGICSMIVDNTDHLCTFTHLGIQCAKRNEIASRLKLRKQLKIDPTNGGFDHIAKTSRSLDLGAIRLCFQTFIEDPETRKFTIPLKPVISDPVHDKKLLPKLIITDISTTSCPISGGKLMLFCNYIDEEDIEVRFFETDINGTVVWESVADLKPPVGEVHKRVGISLLAPAYPFPNTRVPVNVFLQLRRPSDDRTSDPLIFTYLPDCNYESCPLLHFKKSNLPQQMPCLQNQSTTRRGRTKAISSPTPRESLNSKRIKIMDVLNRSDSEDMDDTEEPDDEEDNTSVISPNALPYYQSNDMNNFFSNQYMAHNYLKSDLNNNNLSQIQCNSNQNAFSNGSLNTSISGDLLMECLKTIDMDCLAAIQFNESAQNGHNTSEDWTQPNQTVSYYTEDYNNNNNSNNRSFYDFHTNPKPVETQEKLSFIDL